MASWILVPCLVALRTEFNVLAPSRDRSSDGSIGDSAHASSSSDHNPDETGATGTEDADNINEVHAIDVDADLRKSGWTMAKAVEVIITRHRTGVDNRLQNIIYNRRIWSASWGWSARTYTGSNPHDKHAHFSSKYTTAQEGDTRRWGLLEEDERLTNLKGDGMAGITQAEFNARMDAWWLERMSPDAPDNKQRAALRVAPWQQLVGRRGVSTHDVLFTQMGGQIEQTATLVKDLPEDIIEQIGTVQSAAAQAQILLSLLGPERAAEVARLMLPAAPIAGSRM